jgi:aminopeptidase N
MKALRGTAFLAVACALAALPAQQRNVSGGPLRADQACYDVRHYALSIDVDPAAQRIAGQLRMRAVTTAVADTLALDLDHALQVHEVTLDGEPVAFEHQGGRIVVRPSDALAVDLEFTVAVNYGGKPHVARRPPWDGGFTWAKTKDNQPWIATSCQGEGADLWWPCKDHPSDKPDGFDLYCTVPDGLIVASNGTLVGTAERDGKRTFHWRTGQPIANYCVALNIAPYVELKDVYECIDGTKTPVRCSCCRRASTRRSASCRSSSTTCACSSSC